MAAFDLADQRRDDGDNWAVVPKFDSVDFVWECIVKFAPADHDIRGVLFDWGDTLVHPPGITTDVDGHFGCVEAFFKEDLPERFSLAQSAGEAEWQAFKSHYASVAADQIQVSSETGQEHSFEERFARTLALTFPTEKTDAATSAWMASKFGARVAAECWQIKDAETVLPKLKDRLKLGLLSNYPHAPAVHASLERFDLLRHLDEITVSGLTGWAKPDPRAFAHAAEVMGMSPEQLLYVGDDVVNDMDGAKAFGMHTAWLPRKGQGGAHPSVDVTLEGLTDLVGLLIGDHAPSNG